MPWRNPIRLETIRQPSNQPAQPLDIIMDMQRTVSMNHDVIVRRHNFAGFLLARIPGRSDVSLRPVKNHESFDRLRKIPPHRIGARDMSAQCSERRRLGIDLERNVIGVEACGIQSYQRAQRALADLLMKNFHPLFFKM